MTFTCEKLPNATSSKSLGVKFTMIFGLKIPECPKKKKMTIFTTGPGGYELLLLPSEKGNKCSI